MRLHRLHRIAAFVCLAGGLRAAALEERIELLSRPLLGEFVSLSPDGQRIAYSAQPGGQPAIVIVPVEPPGSRRTIRVEPDRENVAGTPIGERAPPAPLRYLRWATNDRVIYAPKERIVPLPPLVDKQGRVRPNPDGPTIVSPIFVMDAEGRQRGTLIDARHFQETPAEAKRTLADFLRTTTELQATRNEPVRWRMPHLDILGFLPRDREQLIIGTRGAYSMPMQHLVDIRTGNVREFGNEWPAPPGEPQVFDGYRLKIVGDRRDGARPTIAWRDEELGRVQRELERKFPRRAVEILDWNETRARVLARVTGGSDAGRLFVYQRTEDVVVEVLARAPWLHGAKLHASRFFELKAADGASLSGYATWPASPRIRPPPVLVIFPTGFPGRAQPAFDPEAQVLADLGCVVVRLNHRSVGGIRPEDLDALRAGGDRVCVEDARAAIQWLAARYPARPFDARRVAAVGRGFGGYLAVRALQLQPAVFRCGVAIDAPMELRDWVREQAAAALAASPPGRGDVPAALLDHEGADWRKLSVVAAAEDLSQPVLLVLGAGRPRAVDVSNMELRQRLQALGRPVEHLELEPGLAADGPAARVALYRKMEEFLDLHLHGFASKVGPAKEVE